MDERQRKKDLMKKVQRIIIWMRLILLCIKVVHHKVHLTFVKINTLGFVIEYFRINIYFTP